MRPTRRGAHSLAQLDEDYISDLSSSAQSQQNVILVQNQVMETIRGARAGHLSPVTRKMNSVAKATMKHLTAREAAAKHKADLKTSLLMRMQQKLNAESGMKPKDLLRRDQATIKHFKNELKQVVTTDAEKYHPLSSNNPNFTLIDVLPDRKPVYIKMPCGSLWSPCIIELMLGDVE